MLPRTSPLKQHRPESHTARSYHISVIGVPNVDDLAQYTAADLQASSNIS